VKPDIKSARDLKGKKIASPQVGRPSGRSAAATAWSTPPPVRPDPV